MGVDLSHRVHIGLQVVERAVVVTRQQPLLIIAPVHATHAALVHLHTIQMLASAWLKRSLMLSTGASQIAKYQQLNIAPGQLDSQISAPQPVRTEEMFSKL